jgi:hypothetical protein
VTPFVGLRGAVMWFRALVAGGLLAGALSACAVVDPVDSRYDTVSRSLAKARNEAIFLNLVRASHDYPLSFTTIANVTPTMTNTSSFALPTFSVGPPNCLPGLSGTTRSTTCSFGTGVPGAATLLTNNTASNSTAVSTNFNVATQETGSFYDGFLKPIDLHTLAYFIRQDYPRELLFWLFADSFQYQVGPNPVSSLGYQFNPPLSYGCPRERLPGVQAICFREWVWNALLSGLTVEEKSIIKESKGSAGSAGGTKSETIIVSRFCLSPFLMRQARLQVANQVGSEQEKEIEQYLPFNMATITHFSPSPICGMWTDAEARKQSNQPQEDVFKLTLGANSFRIVPRSAYGVFSFLGNLIKIQREGTQPAPQAWLYPHAGRPDEADIPPKLLTTKNEPLISVLQNSGADCFSHTWFNDGDYCVPEDAANTKRIFSLLAQLIAIETTASDLSITPIVRVVQ